METMNNYITDNTDITYNITLTEQQLSTVMSALLSNNEDALNWVLIVQQQKQDDMRNYQEQVASTIRLGR